MENQSATGITKKNKPERGGESHHHGGTAKPNPECGSEGEKRGKS